MPRRSSRSIASCARRHPTLRTAARNRSRGLSAALAAIAVAIPLVAASPQATAVDPAGRTTAAARAAALPDDLRVLSYNVLGPFAAQDKPAALRWGPRRDAVVKVIKDNSPGIFGLQEASTSPNGSAAPWLINQFASGWDVYDPSGGNGQGSPKLIFYKSARFARVSAGTVTFPQNGCEKQTRQLSWVVLRELSDPTRRYWVGNTHLFSTNTPACQAARVTAVAKIHETIASTNPNGTYPIIMMGDFNNRPTDCYQPADAQAGRPITNMVAAKPTYNLAGTVGLSTCTTTANGNWPNGSPGAKSRIDFIFRSSSFFDVVSTDVIGDQAVTFTSGARATPSDHFAVTARLKLLK